jgi:hypothetical protein
MRFHSSQLLQVSFDEPEVFVGLAAEAGEEVGRVGVAECGGGIDGGAQSGAVER